MSQAVQTPMVSSHAVTINNTAHHTRRSASFDSLFDDIDDVTAPPQLDAPPQPTVRPKPMLLSDEDIQFFEPDDSSVETFEPERPVTGRATAASLHRDSARPRDKPNRFDKEKFQPEAQNADNIAGQRSYGQRTQTPSVVAPTPHGTKRKSTFSASNAQQEAKGQKTKGGKQKRKSPPSTDPTTSNTIDGASAKSSSSTLSRTNAAKAVRSSKVGTDDLFTDNASDMPSSTPLPIANVSMAHADPSSVAHPIQPSRKSKAPHPSPTVQGVTSREKESKTGTVEQTPKPADEIAKAKKAHVRAKKQKEPPIISRDPPVKKRGRQPKSSEDKKLKKHLDKEATDQELKASAVAPTPDVSKEEGSKEEGEHPVHTSTARVQKRKRAHGILPPDSDEE